MSDFYTTTYEIGSSNDRKMLTIQSDELDFILELPFDFDSLEGLNDDDPKVINEKEKCADFFIKEYSDDERISKESLKEISVIIHTRGTCIATIVKKSYIATI